MKPVNQQSNGYTEPGVKQREGAHQQTRLLVGDGQIGLDRLEHDREYFAIHVVDEVDRGQQAKRTPPMWIGVHDNPFRQENEFQILTLGSGPYFCDLTINFGMTFR